MQLVDFFLSYFLLLLASSVLITSFYCVTRGYAEILPDGNERRYGKILKGYYFFWMEEKGRKMMGYKDDQLADVLVRMKEYYPGQLAAIGDPFVQGSLSRFMAPADFLSAVPVIRNRLEVKFAIEERDEEKLVLKVYREEPDYVFPEWLRTVMAGCITCTPTIYGNIVYWGALYFFRNSVMYDALFSCFSSELEGVFVVWIAYWISLAWLNTVLWNIYDK